MNMLPPRLAASAPLQLLLACLAGTLITLTPPAAAETVTASGRIVNETRPVTGFERIALSGSLDITVRQGGSEGVKLEGDDNVLPLIETEVDDGTLSIRYKRGTSIRGAGDIRITVDAVRLTALSSAGSGDIRVESLQTPELKVSIAGSSDVRLDQLSTEALNLRISGSGDVSAAGSARRFEISIAGSGDVKAAALAADEVSVRIAGSGNADVTAHRSLDVSVAGSGDVSYGGSADKVKSRTMGSGSVTRR